MNMKKHPYHTYLNTRSLAVFFPQSQRFSERIFSFLISNFININNPFTTHIPHNSISLPPPSLCHLTSHLNPQTNPNQNMQIMQSHLPTYSTYIQYIACCTVSLVALRCVTLPPSNPSNPSMTTPHHHTHHTTTHDIGDDGEATWEGGK